MKMNDKLKNEIKKLVNDFNPAEIIDMCNLRGWETGNEQLYFFCISLKQIDGIDALTPEEFEDVLSDWYGIYEKGVEEPISLDQIFLQFETIWPNMYKQNIVAEAKQRAENAPFPPDADLYRNTSIKKLIALCYQMQEFSGKKPFFLSGKTAGEQIGISQQTAANVLYALVRRGILEITERGRRGRATYYRYIGRKTKSEEDKAKVMKNILEGKLEKEDE